MSNNNNLLLLKSIVLGFVLFCWQPGLRSQCPNHDIWLKTQAQVDSFQFNYPNCTEIIRVIHINGLDINNLHGLSVLTKIHALNIDSTSIVNLDSLNNITELKDIKVSNNPLLENISAIGQITKVIFSFDLDNNDAIVDLTGLSFDTLGYCEIENNDALITLHGLENLTYVMYRLNISANPSLLDLKGLSNLSIADNQLYIVDNDRIKNLEGLENLWLVGYYFRIMNNDSLQSLAGLQNILIGDPSHQVYYITSNLQLDSCHTEPMCEYLADGKIVVISDNAQGCNSVVEVRELCMSVSFDEPGSETDIIVYPNPTPGKLFVNYTDSVHLDHLTIYNHLGMEVMQMIQHVGPIDITHLPNGLYILKFSLNGSIKVASVVKL